MKGFILYILLKLPVQGISGTWGVVCSQAENREDKLAKHCARVSRDAAIIGSHGTYRLQLGNPGFLHPQIMVVGMIAILEFEACLGVGIASRILWGIWSS